MNPKMTFEDAANWLGQSPAWIYAELSRRGLAFSNSQNQFYFDHDTARDLFQFPFQSKVVVFQILKGGTGKTALAFEFAVRAHLYGARVLCIDLDQQANLTQAFNQEAESVPVMVDCLAEGYSLSDSIVTVRPGIDLLPSRIENALLDEVLRLKHYLLATVYRDAFAALKQHYDLIIVDCPPSLGQSVTAAALAADLLIAPVTPDKFALSGLHATYQSLDELGRDYQLTIPLKIVFNKFDLEGQQSKEILDWLRQHPDYQSRLLDHFVCLSAAFPNAALQTGSIFDAVLPHPAKQAIDQLTCALLELYPILSPLTSDQSEELEELVLI